MQPSVFTYNTLIRGLCRMEVLDDDDDLDEELQEEAFEEGRQQGYGRREDSDVDCSGQEQPLAPVGDDDPAEAASAAAAAAAAAASLNPTVATPFLDMDIKDTGVDIHGIDTDTAGTDMGMDTDMGVDMDQDTTVRDMDMSMDVSIDADRDMDPAAGGGGGAGPSATDTAVVAAAALEAEAATAVSAPGLLSGPGGEASTTLPEGIQEALRVRYQYFTPPLNMLHF